jgi:BlaI family penicillinase repressor
VRLPKLSKLEHQIMDALWTRGASSVREILEAFPDKGRPAYTTVQTMVYRLEEKGAIRRVKKIGNAHIFEAAISRSSAQRRLIDELLAFFGGSSQPVVAHLIESGNLTLEDVKEAEQLLIKLKSGKSGRSGKVSPK